MLKSFITSGSPKPILLVIAGCNGSGKSSFSKMLAPSGLIPFDYDLYYLNFYKSLSDSDLREEMAHNMAFDELKHQIKLAVSERSNFCYETNFNSSPLYWPKIFKDSGYELRLLYLCLNSVLEANKRVTIRVQNGGHFVSEQEVQKRYFEGYSHLNNYFDYFDSVDLFDTSTYRKEPHYLNSIENSILQKPQSLPDYLEKLVPDIFNMAKAD